MQIRHCVGASACFYYVPLFITNFFFCNFLFFFFFYFERRMKENDARRRSALPARRSFCARHCADRASSKRSKRVAPSLIRLEQLPLQLLEWSTSPTPGMTKTTTLLTILVSLTPASLGLPWRKTITCSTAACRRLSVICIHALLYIFF